MKILDKIDSLNLEDDNKDEAIAYKKKLRLISLIIIIVGTIIFVSMPVLMTLAIIPSTSKALFGGELKNMFVLMVISFVVAVIGAMIIFGGAIIRIFSNYINTDK